MHSRDADAHPRWHGCPRRTGEMLLRWLLAGLLLEGLVPPGVIVDAGANDGADSCYLADLAPERTVHAIDPSRRLVRQMRRDLVATRPNLRPMLGALSSEANRTAAASAHTEAGQLFPKDLDPADVPSGGERFPLYSVDHLFATQWAGEALDLLHLDVEGHELSALHGATAAIRASRPVLAVELFVHQPGERAVSLLRYLERELGYRAFVVEEVCGINHDCRNLLCLPAAAHDEARFAGSPILGLAFASRALLPVSAATIATHAFPCCQLGGACCSTDAAYNRNAHDWERAKLERRRDGRPTLCCSGQQVRRWQLGPGRDVQRETSAGRADPRLFIPYGQRQAARFASPFGRDLPNEWIPALLRRRHGGSNRSDVESRAPAYRREHRDPDRTFRV